MNKRNGIGISYFWFIIVMEEFLYSKTAFLKYHFGIHFNERVPLILEISITKMVDRFYLFTIQYFGLKTIYKLFTFK